MLIGAALVGLSFLPATWAHGANSATNAVAVGNSYQYLIVSPSYGGCGAGNTEFFVENQNADSTVNFTICEETVSPGMESRQFRKLTAAPGQTVVLGCAKQGGAIKGYNIHWQHAAPTPHPKNLEDARQSLIVRPNNCPSKRCGYYVENWHDTKSVIVRGSNGGVSIATTISPHGSTYVPPYDPASPPAISQADFSAPYAGPRCQ
jgi:hypothetical protein